MANHLGVPGYSARQVADLRAANPAPLILDVREPDELARASLGPEVVVCPLSDLAVRGLAALPATVTADPETPLIVLCHHGVRSAQVVAWLRSNGWSRAYNLDGGIDAYARDVDPAVGLY